MAKYSFKCRNGHEIEVNFPMERTPFVTCSICFETMSRVYYPPRAIALNPFEVLTEWLDDNYRRWRKKSPRKNPHRVIRPSPVPAKDYHTRRNKKERN